MGRVADRRAIAVGLMLSVAATGCYVQQPLPRQPDYAPASWEPVLGITTVEGEEIEFDEPAALEAGNVVGRVDGARYVVPLSDVQRLHVGRKTLDRPKTVLFAAILITVFVVFWSTIGFDS